MTSPFSIIHGLYVLKMTINGCPFTGSMRRKGGVLSTSESLHTAVADQKRTACDIQYIYYVHYIYINRRTSNLDENSLKHICINIVTGELCIICFIWSLHTQITREMGEFLKITRSYT